VRTEEVGVGTAWSEDLQVSLRRARAGIVGGFLAGALVGGVGGRIAMLVLRLASTPNVIGVKSDDGFVIGQITTDTLFLLVLTGVLGATGGIAYLVARNWIPPRWRPWVGGLTAGAIGGAAVIDPIGLDFTVLEPLPLAVTMFVVIPAGYGVLLSVFVERRLGSDRFVTGPALWIPCAVFGVAIGLTGPIGVLILAVTAAGWMLHRRVPALRTVWAAAPVVWLGRAILAWVTGVSLLQLAREVTEIL
jgi:hypothetical protein